MSQRHDTQQRLRTLGEINEIMDSMRMLSLLETLKLSRFIDCQRRVVATLQTAATDFLSFHPLHRGTRGPPSRQAFLIVGSERGFCGDFNTTLCERLDRHPAPHGGAELHIFTLGRKLAADLERVGDALIPLDGPSTAEEVPRVLQQFVSLLNPLIEKTGDMHLTALYHGGEHGDVLSTPVIPAFADLVTPKPQSAHPPRLYLPPEDFFADLVEDYLFAVLHEIVFTSLLNEHQKRVQHLDGATQRLEQALAELRRRNNMLRQEEITEELQVILLGADMAAPD